MSAANPETRNPSCASVDAAFSARSASRELTTTEAPSRANSVAIAGQGNIVGAGDVVEQTRQIFRNLRRILEAAGATPSDVAKLTIFMRDVDQRPLINPVRQEFFGAHRPASTLVEVSALVRPELMLEIEAIAQLPD